MAGFIQFELWKDCNHNCPFCTARGIKKVRDKVASLQKVQNILKEDQKEYDSISLIGGEFFDGQLSDTDTRNEFYNLVDIIADRLTAGKYNRFLICTSLMYEDAKYLVEFLKRLTRDNSSLTEKLMICTSHDPEYRFSRKTFRNWKLNMYALATFFPEVRIHVETIMTQAVVENFLNGTFSVKKFEADWGCTLDFNTPFKCHGMYKNKQDMQKDLPLFFPKRKDFLKFLWEYRDQKDVDFTKLLNVKQHSTNFFYTLNDKDWLTLPKRHDRHHTCIQVAPCQNNCCGYIDSNVKIHKDVEDFVVGYLN